MSSQRKLAGPWRRVSKRSWLAAAATVLMLLACTGNSRPTAVPAETTPGSRGEQLYVATCQSCHGGATDGSMMDIPPPHNANGHTWHHPDCQLIDTVLNGSGATGEMMRKMMGADEDAPRMPAFKSSLSDKDVAAILGYIKTFWTEDQRQFQAKTTREGC
ncbi:MAG: cytochrome c [Chloroflexi bacterium]|nr:cytochrome c [Chloroflexota bacterium]